MMARITRHVMFMQMARIASLRSTCFRLNVGALVVKDNNPIAIGYNGQEPGALHCAGNECPGIVPGRCGTLHAEVNALTKAGKLLPDKYLSGVTVDLYCTDSPCDFCTKFIRQDTSVNVRRIFYETPYRNTEHLKQLRGLIEVYLVTPAGYIVDHFTRQVVELP